MREIIYDTETTGKRYQDGDRVIEVAAVELVDGKLTGNTFYRLINPERDIPDVVVDIHGITNEKVKDAPKFKEILPDLVNFFKDSVAIAHNSDFDEKFLNNEMKLAKYHESFWSVVDDTVDTIAMSRKIWVGKDENGKTYRHSLDHVLDRCHIDRSKRTLHGALIDSELLAEAYLSMKAKILEMGPTLEDDVERSPIKRLIDFKKPLPKVMVSAEELKLDNQWYESFSQKKTSMKL